MRHDTTYRGTGMITLLAANNRNIIGGGAASGAANSSLLTIPAGETLHLRGSRGEIHNPVAFQGTIRISGGVEVSLPGGDFVLLDGRESAGGGVAGTLRIEDGSVFHVGSSSTLMGGIVETAGTGALRGRSTLASTAGLLQDLTIAGQVRLENGEDLALGGTIVNNGNIALEGGSSAAILAIRTATAVTGDGAVVCESLSAEIFGADLHLGSGQTLRGVCRISAPLVHEGTLAPGNGIGTMRIYSNVSLEADAVLETEIDAAGHDQLDLDGGGSITLGGRLVPLVTPQAAAAIGPGQAFEVIDAGTGTISGQFANAPPGGRVAGPGVSFRIDYGPGAADPSVVVLSDLRREPIGAVGAPILLVDDDDNTPDVVAFYTEALDALGLSYQLWDTANSDSEPDAAALSAFAAAIWWSGRESSGSAGPGGSAEASLSQWLGEGGCLLVSSQDYLLDRGGTTDFMADDLGLGDASRDVSQSSVTGVGPFFGGIGPLTLDFPFADRSDRLTPASGAVLAFTGDGGDAAILREMGTSETGTARTLFLGFPFEALPTAADRKEVLGRFMDFCGLRIFADGFESGDTSAWSNTDF